MSDTAAVRAVEEVAYPVCKQLSLFHLCKLKEAIQNNTQPNLLSIKARRQKKSVHLDPRARHEVLSLMTF